MTKPKKRKDDKWELLKSCLVLEEKLVHKSLVRAKYEEDYERCIEYKNEYATVTWLLSVMEHLEETGGLP